MRKIQIDLIEHTKYPHAKPSIQFPYHHHETPVGIDAWMTPVEINALQGESKDNIYMEIGTYDGFSAYMIAKTCNKIICIDPYNTGNGRLTQVMENTIIPNISKLVNITGFSQYVNWIFFR